MEKICSKCGKPMKRRKSSYGEFWGCTGYPDCKHTEKDEKQQPNNTSSDDSFKMIVDEFIALKNKVDELIKEIRDSIVGQ